MIEAFFNSYITWVVYLAIFFVIIDTPRRGVRRCVLTGARHQGLRGVIRIGIVDFVAALLWPLCIVPQLRRLIGVLVTVVLGVLMLPFGPLIDLFDPQCRAEKRNAVRQKRVRT